MISSSDTVNAISQLFCEATKEVIGSSTGEEVSYTQTLQMIPSINLRPDIGCFIMFSGDYSGLMIMNFTSAAALEIYRHSMMKMGLPEEELATEHTSDEVVNGIGELINQVIGKVRQRIEQKYQLVAHNTQPRAIALTTSIILNIESREAGSQELCRRLSFKINRQSFHIELALERSEFVRVDGQSPHEPKTAAVESLMNFEQLKAAGDQSNTPDAPVALDFEALAAQNSGSSASAPAAFDFDALSAQTNGPTAPAADPAAFDFDALAAANSAPAPAADPAAFDFDALAAANSAPPPAAEPAELDFEALAAANRAPAPAADPAELDFEALAAQTKAETPIDPDEMDFEALQKAALKGE